jgi:GH15 family glucan-1,4-alpha-glucosidase
VDYLTLQPSFVVEESLREAASLPIGHRAMIGDGRSAALVRVDGVIDWLCWPRFDSDPVFAQMLDPERGGFTAITPVTRPFESTQRYDPETAVVETIFLVPGGGRVRLVDYMPWSDDPRASIYEIHRRVECIDGEVEMEVVFDPRFDWGAAEARFDHKGHGVMAVSSGGDRLAIAVEGGSFQPRPEGGLTQRFRMQKGDRRWAILSWGAQDVEPVAAYRPFELLRATRRTWRAWSHRLEYDGPWRHLVLRSAITLKLLQYAPSGALVAAPTSSLPEWVGGERNWDYRFAWARDAGLSIRATNLLGYRDEAREFFHFVRDCLNRHRNFQIMLTIDGDLVPAEQERPHLAGYRGSAPVRSGNGAHDQIQIDSAGYVLDAAWVYEHTGGSLTLATWRQLGRLVRLIERMWSQPDHGIWEPRNGVQHHVHSKVMSWVTLDRASRIAALFGDNQMSDRWRRTADAIRHDVLAHGRSASSRYLTSYYGGTHVDGSLLLAPSFQFLPPEHPLVEGTVERVKDELVDRGFVRRYDYDDGVAGPEGAFVICGFWLAEALAMMGRLEEAIEVFNRHVEASNHLGLLAEEVDPADASPLGNFPQAFSHLGLISAACRIDLGLRLRDEGEARTPMFELDVPFRQ